MPLYVYGSDKEKMMLLARENPELEGLLSASLDLYKVQVVWAVRHEMARTVEDVLARRTRCLLLDARESMRVAADVAQLMALEMGKDRQWEDEQVKNFVSVAKQYILN